MKVLQLELDFTQESRTAKRYRNKTPLVVRKIAREGGVSIIHATAICRANGIGGKEVL